MFYQQDPKPWNQYPLMSAFPSDPENPCGNIYFDYSPLCIFDVLSRHLARATVVTDLTSLDYLMNNPPGTPLLEPVRATQRVNAPILPEVEENGI